jgi:molybdopterin-guanine dinucleotide biosynthesis protein MobB
LKPTLDARPGRVEIADLPILGISGWSGSGKTTLIEAALPLLLGRGLRVAVVKHDAHRIEVDRAGKDSDRLFQAGADVLLQGPSQEFYRLHGDGRDGLPDVLRRLCRRYDLVLVEGRKTMPLPKVWLLGDGEDAPPEDVPEIIATLPRGEGRLGLFVDILTGRLQDQWLRPPVLGCVLIGGKSRRMGAPKHLIQQDGRTWLERTTALLREVTDVVVVAGAGPIPDALSGLTRLHDAPDAEGPMAGLLSAMRWAPYATWLVTACDLPDLTPDALRWLLSTRAPGVWATLPKLEDASRVEPLLAHYDFRFGPLVESRAACGGFRLQDLASVGHVISPPPPPDVADAWRNVNTEDELAGRKGGGV